MINTNFTFSLYGRSCPCSLCNDHTRFVYRSSDVEGREANKNGTYHDLLLVKVLRGNPLKTSEVWKGKHFSYSQSRLDQEYGSGGREGVPHQPLLAGPGADDSIIYVVYDPWSASARVYCHVQKKVVSQRERERARARVRREVSTGSDSAASSSVCTHLNHTSGASTPSFFLCQ